MPKKPDQQAIQGQWRLVDCVAQRGRVGTCTTHFLFEGNRVKEFDPTQVAGGDWATFELEPKAEPKRFTMTSQWKQKTGKPASRVDRWLYEIEGDTLRLCWPSVFGQYPDVLSERKHGVYTLVRDRGPVPEAKQPSGRRPIENAVLGRVAWDDDLDRWQAEIEWKPGLRVEVSFAPGDDQDDASAVVAGAEFVRWLRLQEAAARRFAADRLLDIHNEAWNEGKPISARTFAGRLTLESVGIDPDGGGSLYFKDGDLFWGHWVVVSVGPKRAFKGADIAG